MFEVDPDDPLPLYAQLERGIRAAIATGRLREGDQLPTVRQLAVDLRINANTVARVYSELERAGVLGTRRGVGTFVRDGAKILASEKDSRNAVLKSLVRRFLVEADALGFSSEDVIEQLRGESS
ncbi:MAG: GntR family transcriptional regulator [Isosphaeraceae bacterium]